MKAPRPSFTPSRHNVGAYGVRVCEVLTLSFKTPLFDGGFLESTVTCPEPSVVAYGALSANGSLTLEPERWAVRHYRRAVMRGAGVYQAGLWAYLSKQRIPAPRLERAALVVNPVLKGRGGLAHYFAAAYSVGTHSRQLTPLPWSAWGRRTLTAFPQWRGRALPYTANRLIRTRSLWADVTGQPKVIPTARPTATNAPAAYLAQLAPILNRIRFTSPRWRGAAGHHSRRLALLRVTGKALRWPQFGSAQRTLNRGRQAAQHIREVQQMGGPVGWAKKMVSFLDAAAQVERKGGTGNGMRSVRRAIGNRLHSLTIYAPTLLKAVLSALREVRASVHIFRALFSMVRTAVLAALARESEPPMLEPDGVPPPLYVLPKPPAAPLAPPAL